MAALYIHMYIFSPSKLLSQPILPPPGCPCRLSPVQFSFFCTQIYKFYPTILFFYFFAKSQSKGFSFNFYFYFATTPLLNAKAVTAMEEVALVNLRNAFIFIVLYGVDTLGIAKEWCWCPIACLLGAKSQEQGGVHTSAALPLVQLNPHDIQFPKVKHQTHQKVLQAILHSKTLRVSLIHMWSFWGPKYYPAIGEPPDLCLILLT